MGSQLQIIYKFISLTEHVFKIQSKTIVILLCFSSHELQLAIPANVTFD